MKYLHATILLLALYTQLTTVARDCLLLTRSDAIYANPPGTTSSDGFDDVYVLVSCCDGSKTTSVDIPSGLPIFCNTANCTSICHLSQLRQSFGNEACHKTCDVPSTKGRVCMFNAPTGALTFGHVG
jgi:hypothetical protein